jgi:hypothetical protein
MRGEIRWDTSPSAPDVIVLDAAELPGNAGFNGLSMVPPTSFHMPSGRWTEIIFGCFSIYCGFSPSCSLYEKGRLPGRSIFAVEGVLSSRTRVLADCARRLGAGA